MVVLIVTYGPPRRQLDILGACSTRLVFNTDMVDPLALKRIDVYGTDSQLAFRREWDFGVNSWPIGNELRYLVGRGYRRLVSKK